MTTWARTLRVEAGTSVLELHPVTGFTHQLRVMCAHYGHPIVGDDTYPEPAGRDLYDFSTPLHLVAQAVEFVDPHSTMVRTITSFQGLPDRLV